jgi:hypothetical protein
MRNFNGSHDFVSLNTLDEVTHCHSCKHGAFARVFKEASIARVARQVHATTDRLVVALGPQLAADDISVKIRDLRIPTRRRSSTLGSKVGYRLCAAAIPTPTAESACCKDGIPRRGIPTTSPAPPLLSGGTGSPCRSRPNRSRVPTGSSPPM